MKESIFMKIKTRMSEAWNLFIWKMEVLVYTLAEEEDGIGVVEVILILVVLIGLVIIFKSQLTALVNSIFDKITSQSSGI